LAEQKAGHVILPSLVQKEGGSQGSDSLVLSGDLLQGGFIEIALDERRVNLTCDKAGAIHDTKVQRNGGLNP